MKLEKDLTTDEKTLATFCLLLSDPAFAAWQGEQQITEDTYKEICQVGSKFLDPELMIRICERFPGMAAGSHL